jgi:nicotinamidase/pyrazinamidase
MSTALFIVDVQNDFTERGALGVDGGDEVAARISRFLAAHADDYEIVVASRDWHDATGDNGGHFATGEPDFVDTWPVHCVAGTYGAEYDEVFDTSRVTHHLKKGQGKPAYSLFEGIGDDGETAAQLLEAHGVLDIEVVGLATDYCVRASALDAIAAGRHVRVYTDLVAGVHPESSERALAEIAHAGAVLAESGLDA